MVPSRHPAAHQELPLSTKDASIPQEIAVDLGDLGQMLSHLGNDESFRGFLSGTRVKDQIPAGTGDRTPYMDFLLFPTPFFEKGQNI